MVFQKILVAIDFGAAEMVERTLRVAQALPNADGKAQLRLVYVQPLVPIGLLGYVPPRFDEEAKKEAEKKLAEISSKLSHPPYALSTVVRFGAAYPEVLAEAEDWGADLIIVGSHRTAMVTYLLGSSAAAIVRHAKCSVLVVRG